MNGDYFRGTVKLHMELNGIKNLEAVRKLTTIGSNKTFLRYWHRPELMPQGEVENIMTGLRVPREEWFRWV